MSDNRGQCIECGDFFGPDKWIEKWCESCRKPHRSCPRCQVPLEFPSVNATLEQARAEHGDE